MNDRFEKIEAQLQRFIEENTARLFGTIGIENKLAHRLVEAMQEQLQSGEDGRLVAPDSYGLYIHPHFAKDVRANIALLDSLAGHLLETASQNGIYFPADPAISVIPDGSIPQGEFEIHAIITDEAEEQTKGITTDQLAESVAIPEKAFIIVGGDKIVSLEEHTINLGRSLDNQVVLDDARVSRRHAQLRAVNGYYILFDLDSSGGTFVNGERVTQATLQPGDVISAAGVTMVYGEDAIRTLDETQEYIPSPESDKLNPDTLIQED
jgi:hypothetical protein